MLIRNKIGRKSNFVIVVYVLNVFLFKSYEVNVHNAQRFAATQRAGLLPQNLI